jgi:mannose-6-phosphate isomerase-like protein (cupin superfamily)
MPKISRESATQRVEEGPVEALSEDLDGGYTVNFLKFGTDLDQSPFLKGLPDDRCQCPHWGYVTQGRFTYRFADHEEVFEAGDAFYLPPGHAAVGNSPGSALVQFSPSEALAETDAVLMKNMEAMQRG